MNLRELVKGLSEPASPYFIFNLAERHLDASIFRIFNQTVRGAIGRSLLAALLFAVPAPIVRVARADDSPPPVATFAFQTQPGNTGVSQAVSPAVAVVALKKNGKPSRFLAVSIRLGPNPPNPGVLSGTLTQLTDSNGVATFNDLKIDWLGNGYTLVAQTVAANGAFSATSNPFNEIRVGDPCLGPTPVCSSGCPDADGDGLNDAWERAGGIDLNGDGLITDARHDLLLPDADPNKPDIYVHYDWMDYATDGHRCSVDSDCASISAGNTGEQCTGAIGAMTCTYACSADSDCTARGQGHLGEKCMQNVCMHTHDPDANAPGALQAVTDSFANHGINLHIERGSPAPHSLVLSFRTDSKITDACEGASGTDVGIGKYAASIYDIKSAFFDPHKAPAYHYVTFGHYSGCDNFLHCFACPPALNPDGTIKNQPSFGESGLAEVGGNDFIVSLGARLQDFRHNPGVFDVGSTFMHELGHNLGLRHGGGVDAACNSDSECTNPETGLPCNPTSTPLGAFCLGGEDTNAKPNYLSVMNYRYQFTGIQSTATVGSALPVSQRLDYSDQVLPTSGNTPGFLDQSTTPNSPAVGDPGLGLSEPAGLASGTKDIFTFTSARETGIPTTAPSTGPVDWDADMDLSETNVQADTNCGPAGFADHSCFAPQYPILKGHTDWDALQYKFQCNPFFADGANVAGAGLVQTEMSPEAAIKAHVFDPIRAVSIGVRPGCSAASKPIAAGQRGAVSVAIMGAGDFEVGELEPTSLRFHGAAPTAIRVEDIDGDGRPDLVVSFDTRKIRLHPNARTARLTGWLKDSQAFVGEDRVVVVPDMNSAEPNCR